MLKNDIAAFWLKLALAFGLGVGSAVAATFTTFETQKAHATDQNTNEQMLREIRQDVKMLLQRIPTDSKITVPEQPPVFEGYGRAPLPRKQAAN